MPGTSSGRGLRVRPSRSIRCRAYMAATHRVFPRLRPDLEVVPGLGMAAARQRGSVRYLAGVFATTHSTRYARDCACPTYPGNLGACGGWCPGQNGLCAYSDHEKSCHPSVAINERLET